MELEEYRIRKVVMDKHIQLEIPSEWIGQEVEICIKPTYFLLATNLVAVLEHLTKTLWWTSETDSRWEVYYLGQKDTEVGLEKWVADKCNLEKPLESTSIDFFFKNAMSDSIGSNAEELEGISQYRKLYEFYVKSFQKTLVLRSGVIEKTILVIGLTLQKSVIVLKTFAVET